MSFVHRKFFVICLFLSISKHKNRLMINEIIDLFLSFDTIFWNVLLGWYYDILGWKLSKQTSYWSKTGFFSSVKKIIMNFHKIVISSRNNVPKYRIKGHEQLVCCPLIGQNFVVSSYNCTPVLWNELKWPRL